MLRPITMIAVALAVISFSGSAYAGKAGSGVQQVPSVGLSQTNTGSGRPWCPGRGGCNTPQAGTTQTACRGGHMGPNGVMIGCQ